MQNIGGPFFAFFSNLNNWHQLNIFEYRKTWLQWKHSKLNISSIVCWAVDQSLQFLTMDKFFFWHFFPGSFDSVNGRLPHVLFFFVRGIAQAHSNIHLRYTLGFSCILRKCTPLPVMMAEPNSMPLIGCFSFDYFPELWTTSKHVVSWGQFVT
jgi:hypothetical protein